MPKIASRKPVVDDREARIIEIMNELMDFLEDRYDGYGYEVTNALILLNATNVKSRGISLEFYIEGCAKAWTSINRAEDDEDGSDGVH